MSHLERITQQFKAIKKVLNSQGYLTQKKITYPIWKISDKRSAFYLVYSPKTERWNLSGKNKAGERDRLWGIIQEALAAKEVS